MRRVKHLLPLLVVLLLVACQSVTPELEAEFDLQHRSGGFGSSDEYRVRFLPPITKRDPHGDFAQGLAVEVRIFDLDVRKREAYGTALGPNYATGDGVLEQGTKYWFNWHALTTHRRARTEYVRVEIRVAGAAPGPVCNTLNPDCLGYLDVRLVPNLGKGAKGTPSGIMNVLKSSTQTIKLKVLALPDVAPPDTLGELGSLGGGNFDESLGNCVASELGRPGQGLQAVGAGLQAVGAGLQAVGAVGGLFSGPTSSFASDLGSRMTTTRDVASRLVAELSSGRAKHGVSLLVVDDFGGVYDVPASLLSGRGDLVALAESGALSHGSVVLHQLKQMAAQAFGRMSHQGVNSASGQPYYKYRSGDGPYLAIQVVDVAGLNTDDVPGAIRTAMQFLGGAGPVGYQRVVVNMSFTVVPCTVLSDFVTSSLPNFEAYLEAIRVANGIGGQYLAELDTLVSTPVALAQEALFAYLQCPFPTSAARCDGRSPGKHSRSIATSIVHVGASGNYGNDYSLYPAAWPNVVSVGAVDVVGRRFSPERSSYSNAAGVLAPGGLFLLSDSRGQTTVYAGTSFAAPVASLFLALDQMRETPRCEASRLSSQTATTPALALADELQLPLLPAFASSGASAVGSFCSPRR